MAEWRMSLCRDSFDPELSRLIEMDFDDPEQWRQWLRENYPDIIDSPRAGFVADGEVTKQYGTNNRWCCLIRAEDP